MNFKSEKGSITLIALISVVFLLTFLISTYIILASKAQTQLEITKKTIAIYDDGDKADEIYKSYKGKNIIPIYNSDQLMAIGTGETKEIDGKYYDFTNTADNIYILMEDINFSAGSTYSWRNGDDDFRSKFEGNGHTVSITYIDEQSEPYVISYNESNDYKEEEYTFKVIPKLEDGTIANNATVLKDETSQGIGEVNITIKRNKRTNVAATIDSSYNKPNQSITITNPSKIGNNYTYNQDTNTYSIELELEHLTKTLTIIPTPSTATIRINSRIIPPTETNSYSESFTKGSSVTWEVSNAGCITQSGTISSLDDNQTLNITLQCSVAINVTPADATLVLDGRVNQSTKIVDYGTTIQWFAYKSEYALSSGTETVTSAVNKTITLTAKPYVTKTVESYANSASSASGTNFTSTNLANSYDWSESNTSWQTTYATISITNSGGGYIYDYKNFKTVIDGVTYENFAFLPDNATIQTIKVVVYSSMPTYGVEKILVRKYNSGGTFGDASDFITYKYTNSSGVTVRRTTTTTGSEITSGTDGISAPNTTSGYYGKCGIWTPKEFKSNYFRVLVYYKARLTGTKVFYPRYVATELNYKYRDVKDVTGISLNSSSIRVNVNNTSKLTATITPTNATEKNVMWTSSNNSIATVSSAGLVTAKKNGTATITATTVNGKQASCIITVP